MVETMQSPLATKPTKASPNKGTNKKEKNVDSATKASLRAFKSIQGGAIQTGLSPSLPVEKGDMGLYRSGLYRFKDP